MIGSVEFNVDIQNGRYVNRKNWDDKVKVTDAREDLACVFEVKLSAIPVTLVVKKEQFDLRFVLNRLFFLPPSACLDPM